MTEEWRQVPGFPRYEISNHGNIRSNTSGSPRPMKPQTSVHGYLRVTLRKDNRNHRRYLHVLVASAFIGPKPDGHVVRHKDDDKQNCRLTNLHYGTHSDNSQDRAVTQTQVREERLQEVAELLRAHPSLSARDVADVMDLPMSTVGAYVTEVRKRTAQS